MKIELQQNELDLLVSILNSEISIPFKAVDTASSLRHAVSRAIEEANKPGKLKKVNK